MDEAGLISRREAYGSQLPMGVGLMTAAVDIQDDRFEIAVKGWGRGAESWLIEWFTIYGDPAKPYDASHLFIAIDVAHFAEPAAVRAAATAAAERIRAGKRAPGVDRLFAPGEPEWRRQAGAAGQVTLTSAVVDMLTRMARELRVSAMPLAQDEEASMEGTGHAKA